MTSHCISVVSNLSFAAKRINLMLTDASMGKGLLGKVIADDRLAQDAAEFLNRVNQITAAVLEGRGTVGKLLMTDAAYEEMMSAMKLLNNSLEDVREAQPVSSFAGMLLGTSF